MRWLPNTLRPSIVSTESGTVQAFNHLDKADIFDVDTVVESAKSSEYDALVLPGGVANPDFSSYESRGGGVRPEFLRRRQACSSDLPRTVDAGRSRRGRRSHADVVA